MYASKMYREAAYVLHRSSTPTTLRSVAEITSRNRYKSEVILRQDKRVDSVHSNQKSSQCSSDFEFSSRGSIWLGASFPVPDHVPKGTQRGSYFSNAIIVPRVDVASDIATTIVEGQVRRQQASFPGGGIVPIRLRTQSAVTETLQRLDQAWADIEPCCLVLIMLTLSVANIAVRARLNKMSPASQLINRDSAARSLWMKYACAAELRSSLNVIEERKGIGDSPGIEAQIRWCQRRTTLRRLSAVSLADASAYLDGRTARSGSSCYPCHSWTLKEHSQR